MAEASRAVQSRSRMGDVSALSWRADSEAAGQPRLVGLSFCLQRDCTVNERDNPLPARRHTGAVKSGTAFPLLLPRFWLGE
jgi:hypothetical protein